MDEVRKLATVQQIRDIQPIEGADRIEVATVEGWHVVIAKRDNFKVGDKVVYIEIDSVVPETDTFAFMRERNFRVRTIKLRKQVSEGLIMPISILKNKDYQVGTDVTKELGIVKYDPEAKGEEKKMTQTVNQTHGFKRFMMHFGWFRKLYFKRHPKPMYAFPDYVGKTDEPRIQNCVGQFEQWKKDKVVFDSSEKIDGKSSSYVLTSNDKYRVCCRNYGLREIAPTGKDYWEISKKYDIEPKIREIKKNYFGKHDTIAFQGEILGKKIQQDKYQLPEHIWKVYNLKVNGVKVPFDKMKEICDKYGFPTVDIIDNNFVIPENWTIDDMVNHAKGNSLLNPNIKREGLVFRSKDYTISFKVINQDFLLKYHND